jgi:hypothetical protein
LTQCPFFRAAHKLSISKKLGAMPTLAAKGLNHAGAFFGEGGHAPVIYAGRSFRSMPTPAEGTA